MAGPNLGGQGFRGRGSAGPDRDRRRDLYRGRNEFRGAIIARVPGFVPVPDLLGWPYYDGYISPYFYPQAGIPYTGTEVYPPVGQYSASPDAYAPAPYLPPSTDGQPVQPIWYYCQDPMGYYPYVRDCNGQWQAVPASVLPPPQPEGQ